MYLIYLTIEILCVSLSEPGRCFHFSGILKENYENNKNYLIVLHRKAFIISCNVAGFFSPIFPDGLKIFFCLFSSSVLAQ